MPRLKKDMAESNNINERSCEPGKTETELKLKPKFRKADTQ